MLAVEHNWPTAFKRSVSALPFIATNYAYRNSHFGQVKRTTMDETIKA